MKDKIATIIIALLIASNLYTAILLSQHIKYITSELDKLQTIVYAPKITATPTPDKEKISLKQENEKLKQDNITLSAWKQDLEGFLDAQIRR